jgi:hypothetical protein
MSWIDELSYDPIIPLLASGNSAIVYWTRRELLDQNVPDPKNVLWDLKIPHSILRKQNGDGSWTYPGKRVSEQMDKNQVETYRQLGFLIEMFGFDKRHPSIRRAAEYIFSKQTLEGDIRGIYATQYTPNYTAAFIELLVKAGYENDKRTAKAFNWLNSVRQNDGGWALAVRTKGMKLDAIYHAVGLVQLDRAKPFSHFITGVVLRAYAAHSVYRESPEAIRAARLLVSRFFERDRYADKGNKRDWIRFSFPFWQTDILSSLSIIGLIEPDLVTNENVLLAKRWFVDHQRVDGLFEGHLLRDRYHDLQLWCSFAVCRALKELCN